MLGSAVCNKLKILGVNTIPISRNIRSGFCCVDNYAKSPDCDVLIHLGESSNRHWVNQNILEYEPRMLETVNELISKNYKKIVYASSALLYGDLSNKKSTVGDKIFINDGYTKIKKKLETIILKNEGVALRLTNIYGSQMSPNNVVNSILRQLGKNEPVVLMNTSPVRDFLYIEDAAEAIVDAALGNVVGVLNVGSGIGTSIYDLARLILKLSNQEERKIVSLNKGAYSYLVVDIDLTIKKLSWRPMTPLILGLGKLINRIDKR